MPAVEGGALLCSARIQPPLIALGAGVIAAGARSITATKPAGQEQLPFWMLSQANAAADVPGSGWHEMPSASCAPAKVTDAKRPATALSHRNFCAIFHNLRTPSLAATYLPCPARVKRASPGAQAPRGWIVGTTIVFEL